MTTTGMSTDLTVLLEIQDLQSKVRELRSETGLSDFEQEEFGIDPDQAVSALEAKVEELEDRLSDEARPRYDRVAGSVDRVVVPVIHGTCYGCFTAIPTATVGERDPNATLTTCQHCGRFLYFS
jgi:predicted  nucleic acid-binding Zn-ribbon protein